MREVADDEARLAFAQRVQQREESLAVVELADGVEHENVIERPLQRGDGRSILGVAGTNVRCGWRARACAIIAGLKSTPTPDDGLSAASVSPMPQPISRTRAPSGIKKRK